jgi:hypothetical protein
VGALRSLPASTGRIGANWIAKALQIGLRCVYRATDVTFAEQVAMRFLITASNAAPVVVSTKRQSRDVLITDEKGRQYGIHELDLFYFDEPPERR